MECRKQLCEKCKKKEDDYFLVTLKIPRAPREATPSRGEVYLASVYRASVYLASVYLATELPVGKQECGYGRGFVIASYSPNSRSTISDSCKSFGQP